MLLLVFSDRHKIGLVNENVYGHEGGISKEAGVDTLVGLIPYYLFFNLIAVGCDSQCLAGLVFERSGAHQLADAHMHVQKKIHL